MRYHEIRFGFYRGLIANRGLADSRALVMRTGSCALMVKLSRVASCAGVTVAPSFIAFAMGGDMVFTSCLVVDYSNSRIGRRLAYSRILILFWFITGSGIT